MLYSTLWFILGLLAAIPVHLASNRLPLERSITMLGWLLIVAATIYQGFALIWGDARWLLIETIGLPVFGLFFVMARKHSPYWLALGWALHPVWDVGLHLIGPGHSVAPMWYAISCVAFDLSIGISIFWKVNQCNTEISRNEPRSCS